MHWMAGDQPKRYVQYAQRVLTPPEDVREELWIFSKLALASRVPLYGAKPVYHLFKALDLVERLPVIGPRVAFSSDQLIGLTLRMASGAAPRKKQIRDHPHGQLLEQNRPGTFLGKRVLTNDGRVDLAPESFVSATPKLEDDYKRLLGEQGSLKLITKREPFTHNSWTHNFKPFVGPKRTTNYLYLNPGDAKKRRLKDGDGAEISSAFGQVEIPVRITEDLMPGVVAFPHGWGHQNAQGLSIAREHPGVNANLLTPDGPEGCEALSGMAHMTGLVVEVRKAKPRKRARNMP
jgi:anaerobic selenocysteine-containing dehydrogenase